MNMYEYENEYEGKIYEYQLQVTNLIQKFKELSNKSALFCFGELSKTPLIKIKENYLQLPMNKDSFKRIREYTEKTPFGLGKKKTFDKNIRRGRQINPNDIKMETDYLKEIKKKLKEVFKKDKIEIEFYKMLIYRKKGHFKRHKDTSRRSDHFGTLLLFLPSVFEGGDFNLFTDSTPQTYNYSLNDYKRLDHDFTTYWLAFYTDVEHEITPIQSGYRCVLAFNLYSEIPSTTENRKSKKKKLEINQTLSGNLIDLFNLSEYLENYFYLLNHSYPKSFNHDYLRGVDFSVWKELNNEFKIELVEADVINGLNEDSSFLKLEFSNHNECYEIDLRKLRELYESDPCGLYQNRTIATQFHLNDEITPQSGEILGNEPAPPELVYSKFGFLITPKTKDKIIGFQDIRFKFKK